MRYKRVYTMFVFIILSVLVNSAVGKYDCPDILDIPIINVTLNSTGVVVIDSLEINNLADAFVENSIYLQTTVENNMLTVETTEELANFEKNGSFYAIVVVECDEEEEEDEYLLVYNINFEESNNCDELRFEDSYYSYIFYDSLFRADSFNMDLKRIAVECINNPVSFFIEDNDYFAIEDSDINVDYSDYSNTYYVRLKVLKDILAPFDKTLTLTVLDDENRTASTTFRVEVIESSYSYLTFTESMYFGYIDENLDIVLDNGPIAFEGDVDLDNVDIQISPEFSIFFEINSTSEITLSVSQYRSMFELINKIDVINITLIAFDVHGDDSDETTVILDLGFLKKDISINTTTPNEEDKLDDEEISEFTETPEIASSTPATSNEESDEDDEEDNFTEAPEIASSTPATSNEESDEDDEANNFAEAPEISTTVSSEEEDSHEEEFTKTPDTSTSGFNDDEIEFADEPPMRNFDIFNSWISRSRSNIVVAVVFTTTILVSAIIYLKLRLAARRREF